MELVVPFMMLILKIYDEQPMSYGLERPPVLYETQADCFAAADAVLEEVAAKAYLQRSDLRHWCLPVPQGGEYEMLFESIEASAMKAQ